MRNNYWASEHPIGDPRPAAPGAKHQRLYEPVTIGLIVVAVVGAAMSAVSSIMEGQQAKKAAQFKSDVALRNAMTARANAAFDAEQQRKVKFRRLGAIKAAGGASGLQFAGSVIDIFQSSIIESNIEIDNIIRKGELRAQGFTDEATLHRVAGENAETSSFFNAAGDVISGATGAIGAFNTATRLDLLQGLAESKV